MDATVSQSSVDGQVTAPPSKSYTHRAVLAAGYTETGSVTVHNPLDSADTRATVRAVEAYGGTVTTTKTGLRVEGFGGRPTVPTDIINCANSGTTMRLATAAAALADGTTVLTGDASLRGRPQGPLLRALETLGARTQSTRANGQAPLVIEGIMTGGSAAIPGDVSSQFVTALLMAGAVTEAGLDLTLQTELKSAPYVAITREVLEAFGVTTRQTGRGFLASGYQQYTPPANGYNVPGDFSSVSYLLAAGALAGGTVTITGVRPSEQGDEAIISVLKELGAPVNWDTTAGELTIKKAPLTGTTVDVAATPDLFPTLAVLGAAADGTTTLVNCEHVRYKEVDRVSAMAETLTQLGARVEETEHTLTIHGDESDLTGTRVDGRGDHRVIMALAVAGLVATGETTVTGADHAAVSFPEFFETLSTLGATVSTAAA
jgi:3-phosphoshikimate 1-carboxyvinyltransferase (EC 2.5.1.19)